MNTDEARSIELARLCGWQIFYDRSGMVTQVDDDDEMIFYFESHHTGAFDLFGNSKDCFSIAWELVQWVHKQGERRFRYAFDHWYFTEGHVLMIREKDAQRLLMERIYELAVKYGLLEQRDDKPV